MDKTFEHTPYAKISHYLYSYNSLDAQIEELESIKSTSDYNQNYTKWIKHTSSSLEEQVIHNIDIERISLKIRKWKNLITLILNEYKKTDTLKYDFICLKYFEKLNPEEIEKKLNIDKYKQKDIKAEILHYIFLICIKKNMLKEVN